MKRKVFPDAEVHRRIRARLPALRKLLKECDSHWSYEDPVYRFYHQSFKVYGLQEVTERIVKELRDLAPGVPLNASFEEIVTQGTGRGFKSSDNRRWTKVTRPMVEAFFHARFFLEMTVRYGGKPCPKMFLPSGWAALLCLYNMRW